LFDNVSAGQIILLRALFFCCRANATFLAEGQLKKLLKLTIRTVIHLWLFQHLYGSFVS
jgi:hypothetical protein